MLVGKVVTPHEVPGEITVWCLECQVTFCVGNKGCKMSAGEMIYLTGSEEHSPRANGDYSLILTILLKYKKVMTRYQRTDHAFLYGS